MLGDQRGTCSIDVRQTHLNQSVSGHMLRQLITKCTGWNYICKIPVLDVELLKLETMILEQSIRNASKPTVFTNLSQLFLKLLNILLNCILT